MGGRGVAGVSRQFLGGGRIVSRCGGVSAAGMGAVSGRRRRDSGLFAGRGVSAAVVRKPGISGMPVCTSRGRVHKPEAREGDAGGRNRLGSDNYDGKGIRREVGGNRGCACGAADAERGVYEFDSACKVTF